MLISPERKECHILISCLFVNLRLTHEPCLGITIVSLYCFGSPGRKFSNYSYSEQISGHITEIANYSYPRLNYGSPDVTAAIAMHRLFDYTCVNPLCFLCP